MKKIIEKFSWEFLKKFSRQTFHNEFYAYKHNSSVFVKYLDIREVGLHNILFFENQLCNFSIRNIQKGNYYFFVYYISEFLNLDRIGTTFYLTHMKYLFDKCNDNKSFIKF